MSKLVTKEHLYADILKGYKLKIKIQKTLPMKNLCLQQSYPTISTLRLKPPTVPLRIFMLKLLRWSSSPQNNILKGYMAQTQNQKNPTHEKPVPATVLANNLDTD